LFELFTSDTSRQMTSPCEYSKLTVPADHAYAIIAAGYVGGVAKLFGFSPEDLSSIERSVEKTLEEIIAYSFEPGERDTVDLSCERIPEGLKIIIHDHGLPLDAKNFSVGSCEPADQDSIGKEGSYCIDGSMDEVRFNNLGRDGKQTILIKYLPETGVEEYVRACEIEPYTDDPTSGIDSEEVSECEVRLMRPEDAVDVSKSVYRTYRYSYLYDHIYYPDRLTDLNEAGKIVSAVAVSNDQQLVGHCALMDIEEDSRIAQIGQGVVMPGYRKKGCFIKMAELLRREAESRNLFGMYALAVTNHTYSQRVSHRIGLNDCGIILCFIPETVSFKGFSQNYIQRISVVLQFGYIGLDVKSRVFAPSHHSEIISRIYMNLGQEKQAQAPHAIDFPNLEAKTLTHIKVIPAMNFAVIRVQKFGKDFTEHLRSLLKDLLFRKMAVINLYLDLSDPWTCRLTEKAEELGFFFAGVLPGGGFSGDSLILQYLENVPFDYENILVHSDMARELISYVRLHDPDRKNRSNPLQSDCRIKTCK
jgi:anti-sigma regulatory factor (Ser/Thr protein kinase)